MPAFKPLWVTVAVKTFVVGAYHIHNAAIPKAGYGSKNVGPHVWMPADCQPFLGSKSGCFGQYLVRNTNFAKIMQVTSHMDYVGNLVPQTHCKGQRLRDDGNFF